MSEAIGRKRTNRETPSQATSRMIRNTFAFTAIPMARSSMGRTKVRYTSIGCSSSLSDI